jgi:membrane-bound lytic murein transglycosylase A
MGKAVINVKPNPDQVGLALAAFLVLLGVALYVWRPVPVPDGLVLEKAGFDDLTGWAEDQQSGSLMALLKSCARFATLPAKRSLGAGGTGGIVGDWTRLCAAAKLVTPENDTEARRFFETWFEPWHARNRDDPEGVFTGYYEPALQGSRTQRGAFQTPLLARPSDLVTVELKPFRKDLAGRRIAGRLKNDRLVPYPDRAGIVAGKLGAKAQPLVWVDDPVSAFFLQIQGSGRVTLADGGEMRVGYAATNGQPYTAIGRELIRRGVLTRENVSLQTIRKWLAENPDEAGHVMALNKSYVFFRELTGEGPIGAQSVALTPERSLAVDRKYIPLGVPLWLQATAPSGQPGQSDTKLHRLMIAQDTGGAIRGPVRGDVFWGYGARAEEIAGRMNNRGQYYLLLPKTIAVRLKAAREKKDADQDTQ